MISLNLIIFMKIIKKNNFNNYKMENKKFQKYFVKACFKNNDVIQNLDIIKKFKDKFHIDIALTLNDIKEIKNEILGNYNKLNIYDVCSNILIDKDLEFKVNATDIIYKINFNDNKFIERNEKVLVLGTRNMRNILKNENINNYFIDTTYKIMPKFWKKYKLMTISAYNREIKATNIACLFYMNMKMPKVYFIFLNI